jgi:hypothetical protein
MLHIYFEGLVLRRYVRPGARCVIDAGPQGSHTLWMGIGIYAKTIAPLGVLEPALLDTKLSDMSRQACTRAVYGRR